MRVLFGEELKQLTDEINRGAAELQRKRGRRGEIVRQMLESGMTPFTVAKTADVHVAYINRWKVQTYTPTKGTKPTPRVEQE